jgi:DNA (cytosine-5)-methyltransferase 1
MSAARNAVVASDLARSSPPVETFLASAGEIVRIVRRRDRDMPSRTTLAATHLKDGPLTSGEAEAAFLRRSERPNWGMGADSVRFADLFCGCGSLALGTLEAARALHMRGELRLAADIDLNALRVLRASLGVDAHTAARWNLTRHVKADPTAMTSASEREMVARVGSALRIAVAGPPCQGHSALNNHSRHDDVRNHLYLRVVRFAALTEPDYVLIEPDVVDDLFVKLEAVPARWADYEPPLSSPRGHYCPPPCDAILMRRPLYSRSFEPSAGAVRRRY